MSEAKFPYLIDAAGNKYNLLSATVSLGRAADNQIVLASDSVSRHHALIIFTAGQFLLRDLGSKNGTKVNGLSVLSEVTLEEDAKIALGDVKLTFKHNLDDETRTLTHISNKTPLAAPPAAAPLELDVEGMQVRLHGEILNPPLSLLEWRLLVLLYQNQGKVCSRDLIIETIYQNSDPDIYDSAIETLVSRLRKRLRMLYPDQLPFIRAVRGVGYKLDL